MLLGSGGSVLSSCGGRAPSGDATAAAAAAAAALAALHPRTTASSTTSAQFIAEVDEYAA